MQENLIAHDRFVQIAAEASRMGQSLQDVLISRGVISKEYFLALLSRLYRVEIADLARQGIDADVLGAVSEEIARGRNAVPFRREEDGTIDVAMGDPTDLEAISYLENFLKAKVRPFLATDDDLNRGFSIFGQRTAQSFKKIIEERIAESLQGGEEDPERAAGQVPIVAIVNNLISHAASLGASDIHIEIMEDAVLVRYRIDGILREVVRIPTGVHPAVVARIKLLARLKVDEHGKPQDGRFRYSAGDVSVDVRVSVIPTFHGEKVEMRLLSAAQKPMSFEELGMAPDVVERVGEGIKKSYGMVLVCGPTGSGKTSTLYAIMGILNQPGVNIVTIEDPIEYDIKYVNQIQVNPQASLTFASGLRSILRQDPNIVMVGEIRDEETADISVNAALTGHLLLSSLHTNDAPTAVPRLLDMNIPSFLVGAVLNVVVAQRLVRKICPHCMTAYQPDPDQRTAMERQIKDLGVGERVAVPKTLYRGAGCSACGDAGYRGRTGIFEVMDIDEKLRSFIAREGFSLEVFRDLARDGGFTTMFEDGMRKIEHGITTIEEVLRVIRE